MKHFWFKAVFNARAYLIIGVLGDYISEIKLNKDRALEAAKPLCLDFDMDALALSAGVLQIVNNNMVSALKRISIGKGDRNSLPGSPTANAARPRCPPGC